MAEGIAAALVGDGFGLVELHAESVDLEGLFLQLTGGAPVSARSTAA